MTKHKRSNRTNSIPHTQTYVSLLESLKSDLVSLIYQLERDTTNKVSNRLPTEMEFDAVPIIRKLKDAEKLTDESIWHYKRQLSPLNDA